MPGTNAFNQDVLQHYFENANHANIGDATGLVASTTAGVYYISLHTADPGEGGDQTTNEATYTGYQRISVARSAAEWTVTATDPPTVDNDNPITFDVATGGSNTITHVGVGTDASGAGNLLFKFALDSSLAVSSGITPEFAAGALNITLD